MWLSCLTLNALLRKAVCSAQDALLGIVSIYDARQTYRGQRKSYSGWTHRIQGKFGYLCLTPNALLRIAVCSARDSLLGIVSIYEVGQIYAGQRSQARKCGYSEQGILGRTCGYTELSKVRHSYRECPTPNIGTIRNPASYKILLRLEKQGC